MVFRTAIACAVFVLADSELALSPGKGGFDYESDVDESLTSFFDSNQATLMDAAQSMANMDEAFLEFTPIKYCTQVVAGRIYHVRVRTAESQFIDVEVFEGTSASPDVSLTNIVLDMAEDEPVTGCFNEGEDVDPEPEPEAPPAKGGFGHESDVDESLMSFFYSNQANLMDEAQTMANMDEAFLEFTPMKYCTQVVAGRIYRVRVRTAESQFMDVEVFEGLSSNPEVSLTSITLDVAEDDPVTGCFTDEGEVVDTTQEPEAAPGKGGFGYEYYVDESLTSFFDSNQATLMDAAQTMANMDEAFLEFTPIKYCTQVVAGRIYHVRVRTAESQFIDVEVFEGLSSNPEVSLTSITLDVAEDEPVTGCFNKGVLMHPEPAPKREFLSKSRIV